jgi:ribonucleoside-diphosphate reductase alpha chain
MVNSCSIIGAGPFSLDNANPACQPVIAISREICSVNVSDSSSPYFKPKQHIDVQAAAQRWIDSSISKTANVPSDYPYEDFKQIYHYAYSQGLKGCTTFRFNPEVFQGVLVKEQDLENTVYRFTLEDGSTVELTGNEEIEYDGEVHTAGNLFDALKEGYYGKF